MVSDASCKAYKCRGTNSSAHCIMDLIGASTLEDFFLYMVVTDGTLALELQTSSYSLSRPFTI